MALRLAAVKAQEFTVAMPEGEFHVSFRPATVAEEIVRRNLFADRREEQEVNSTTVIVVTHFNQQELLRKDCFLTLESCDIEDAKGRRLLRSGMTEVDFNTAWGKLPAAWATEIYDCCLAVNPNWGNSKRVPVGEVKSAEADTSEVQ
jgi:hypothetical protein